MEQQFYMLSYLLAAIFALFAAATESSAASICNRTCSSITVPYPFGFSEACNITLNCSTIGNSPILIGEFKVHNITSESILLDVPFKCNRSMNAFNSLFGKNFAPTRNNSLFLKECPEVKKNISTCNISNLMLQDSGCSNSSKDNISVCFSSRTGLFDKQSVPGTGCGVLYTSMFFEILETEVVKLETMELGWWMPSPCQCSHHAESFTVKGTSGCRCRCLAGFDGDGFTRGLGCRKAKCSVSNYLKGTCGPKSRLVALVEGVLGGAFIMALLALVWCQIHRKSSCQRKRKSLRHLLSQNSCTVPLYSYKVIEMATNGFSETQLLGTGAYGTVYAGKLCNKLVAIKKIKNRDNDSIEQVMNEIKLLSSVDHPNLVQLLGCCIERGEQILVYEYMPNGTLAQHLQRERGPALPWTVRLTIATETARAIAYLHSVVHPPIYHRDIKSSNILLDYNYSSKVADFGLSRIGMTESSHVSTAPQGTPGYVDPQYHQNFHLSDKSDVYSFGVVLIEIITALKAIDFSRAQSEVNLAALAINRISKGNVNEIIDPFLDPLRDEWTVSSIHKVAELAFRCLAYQRETRPSMIEVADELKQIQLSGWAPTISEDNVFMSTVSSFCSSPSSATERSCGTSSKSRRLVMLSRLEEVEVESPVSVDDPWFSEQSSPSENSLLSNIAR